MCYRIDGYYWRCHMNEDVKTLQKISLDKFRKKFPDIEKNLLWEENKNSIKDARDIFHYMGFRDGYEAGKEAVPPKMKQTFDFDHMKDGDEVKIRGIKYVLHIGGDEKSCEECGLFSMGCMDLPCGDGIWKEQNK